MAYVPFNVLVYQAAFAGAIAGLVNPIGAAIVDPNTTDYAPIAGVAAVFAQAVDTAFNPTAPNGFDTDGIKFLSQLYHSTHPLGFAANPTPGNTPALNQANWTVVATAIVAAVKAGDTNFGTQGITPGGLVTGGSSNRAYGAGGATTAAAATITAIAACKLIAKTSGIFKAWCNFSYAGATAADVITLTVKVFTDAVAGTPLTLVGAASIGFGSNGVAQPGNVAVNNNGAFAANVGAGITLTGANAGYTADTKTFTQGTGAAGAIIEWDNIIGSLAPAATESPFALGTTCCFTVSVTNSVAARATGNIDIGMFEM